MNSSPTTEQVVSSVLQKHQQTPGALLPILHDIQEQMGYVPPESVPTIAVALNQSRAEIHGVISFYHQFRTTPPGTHTVEICRAEACQAMGSRILESYAKATLNVDFHGTTAERDITLEPVYCLGNCACGPSIRVNDEIVGRVTPEKLDEIVASLKTQKLELA